MTTETDTTDTTDGASETTDSTDSKDTYVGKGRTIPDAPDFAPEEWTKEAIAWAIQAGVNGRPTGDPLTKSQLNSIYAYFTGEFHYHPMDHATDNSSSFQELRQAVAHEAAFSYDPGPSDLEQARQYRKAQLAELLEAVASSEDQRGWV